jgi:hypothetical protein
LGLLEPCLFGRLRMSVVANTCTLLLQSTEKHLSKQQKRNNNYPSQENNTKNSYNYNRLAPLPPPTPKVGFSGLQWAAIAFKVIVAVWLYSDLITLDLEFNYILAHCGELSP